MKMSDKQFDEFKAALNDTIHEIVYAVHHADEDNPDDALNCLMTASGTLEREAERLVKLSQ